MVVSASVILVVVAVILFTLAALNVPARGFGLGWAGLAFFAASFLV